MPNEMGPNGILNWRAQVRLASMPPDVERDLLLAVAAAAIADGKPLPPELAAELGEALQRGELTERAVDEAVAYVRQIRGALSSAVAKLRRIQASGQSLRALEARVADLERDLRAARDQLQSTKASATALSSMVANLNDQARMRPAFFGGEFDAEALIQHLADSAPVELAAGVVQFPLVHAAEAISGA